MSHPLYIAFIWHQHQPLYKSRATIGNPDGHYRMPWVRLHGTKDYLDLVLVLANYPRLHQTVNLVPSLILQLEDYVAGTALDPYLKVALTPVEELTLEQKKFAIAHFFDANRATLIDPHPRYAELFYQHQEKGTAWCLEHWSLTNYGDLAAWHNLAWIDPLFWDDPDIAGWLQKGREFTLGDRQRIYSKQREIISRILPQHRAMQEAGQLEVMTTPYTHPILPLLADTDAGRVALPTITLPEYRFQWAEDIPRHLRKAKELYSDRFGCQPRGLWPSEQSVSPAVLPYIAEQGFRWICSDEGILGNTLQRFFSRDEAGLVHHPELLYQPYRLETIQGDLAIVFRDHRLSDLLGFTYSAMPPEEAARSLVGEFDRISYALKQRQPSGSTRLEEPWLVTIALDGENCWEYYERDGLPFLQALYGLLSDRPDLQLVTVSEFLDKYPATAVLPSDQLHSGSWVDANFTTWIGDPAKNRAWDLLAAARQTLANHPEASEETNPDAWEALYAAEGSDWFWWFGEGHSSSHDALFDQLFREHLAALYQALNEPVPIGVRYPVELHSHLSDRPPEGFITPTINGRADHPDWNRAGRIEIGGARGTMHRSSIVQRILYGVNPDQLVVRLDFKQGAQPGADLPPEVNLLWFYADQDHPSSPVSIAGTPDEAPLNYRFHKHLGLNLLTGTLWLQAASDRRPWQPTATQAEFALDSSLELMVPWADLPVQSGYGLQMTVILSDGGRFRDALPEQALVPIWVP
jgi:alpha-amylase/alpha-mannosidase (GH57 family)